LIIGYACQDQGNKQLGSRGVTEVLSQPEYQRADKNHWLIVMDLEIEAKDRGRKPATESRRIIRDGDNKADNGLEHIS